MMAENKVGDEKLLLNINGIDQQKTFQLAKRFADNRLAEILDGIINFRIEEEQRRAEEEQRLWEEEQRQQSGMWMLFVLMGILITTPFLIAGGCL